MHGRRFQLLVDRFRDATLASLHPGLGATPLVALLDSLSVAVLVTEASLRRPGPRIVYANPAFERMTGISPAAAIGTTPRRFQGPLTDRSALARFRRELAANAAAGMTVVNYRHSGEPYSCAINASLLGTANGDRYFIAFEREVPLN